MDMQPCLILEAVTSTAATAVSTATTAAVTAATTTASGVDRTVLFCFIRKSSDRFGIFKLSLNAVKNFAVTGLCNAHIIADKPKV